MILFLKIAVQILVERAGQSLCGLYKLSLERYVQRVKVRAPQILRVLINT